MDIVCIVSAFTVGCVPHPLTVIASTSHPWSVTLLLIELLRSTEDFLKEPLLLAPTMHTQGQTENAAQPGTKKTFLQKLQHIYEVDYKRLGIITVVIVLLAMFQVGYQVATTGDFVHKAISLKGGATITIVKSGIDTDTLKESLTLSFPGKEINVRGVTELGTQIGAIVEIGESDLTKIADYIESIKKMIPTLTEKDYSVEQMGPALSESFFRDTIRATIFAFIFMSIAVFLYFREAGPAAIVIAAGFSDIISTVAVVNIIGLKISTAGVAAFLMLIGYSADNNILLSTRLLKQKHGHEMERVYDAAKTGLTMTFTAIAAVLMALMFSQSDVIKEIMIIILIGQCTDILYTWVQNVAILRWYIERKHHRRA